MKFCPDCGCENIDEAQFCRNCGLKFDVEVQESSLKKREVNTVSQTNVLSDNPIISKLFFKSDKYTGELRFAKAKSFSILIFVLMFAFSMTVGIEGVSFFVLLLSSVIFALIFAVPVYVVGFILGLVADKISE